MLSESKKLIVQFCKAPEPGKVKTRMRSSLSKVQACELHKFLAIQVYNNVSGFSGDLDYQLWVSDKHEWFYEWPGLTKDKIFVQHGSGLGDKLLYTATKAFDIYDYIIFVGSDCPFVETQHLNEVCTYLKQNKDLVFIPAHDGGYVLIALKRNGIPLLTEEINWGTDTVLDQSISKANSLNLDYALLEPQFDIDRPEDLVHLKKLNFNLLSFRDVF